MKAQLALEDARKIWKANGSIINQIVEVLYAVVEHLEELRGRIFKILIAMAIGTLICYAFYNQIYAFLLKPINGLTMPLAPGQSETTSTLFTLNQPQTVTGTVVIPGIAGTASVTTTTQILLPKGITLSVDMPTQRDPVRPVFLRPTEMFMTTFKIAILGGLALALPVILYQVIAFVWPALIYESERRWVFVIVPSATVFFVTGMLFCYYFLLPFALKYLLSFGGGIAAPLPALSDLISFITNLMFWIGVVFETPLVVFFLAKLHIVTYQKLKSMWKVAFLISAAVGAVITPTPDPFNMLLVAVPIFLLYLIGVFLARFA